MPEDVAAKSLAEVRDLKVKLYGSYPPTSEDDIGAIGLIQRDLTKIRKTFRFLEGIPGVMVKMFAAAALASIWRLFQ